MDTAFNYFHIYNLLEPLHEPSLSNSSSTASIMSSNISLPDFDDHQFLVNSLQNSVSQSRGSSQVVCTNNDYSLYQQQQPMTSNLMALPNQGAENMFEPSFGYSAVSPRSSRIGTGATFSTDFGYFAADTTDHKQYNWLYDSMDAYMPTMANVDGDLLVNSLLQQQDGCFSNEAIETAIGGMSCNYVSMTDVSSLVSDMDCKHLSNPQMRLSSEKQQFMDSKLSTSQSSNDSQQYSSIFSSNSDTSSSPKRNRSFSLSETSNNSDDDSDLDDMSNARQSDVFAAWRNPPAQDQKIFIKIKKSHSSGTMNSNYNKSLGQRRLSKKSFTNLYLTSVNQAKNMGKRNEKVRRKFESPPNSAKSTSSLSSLTYSSNALSLSEPIGRDLAGHGGSEEEEDTPYVDDEDDDEDDDYRHAATVSTHTHSKKGRNVDKACNHCKRSHLRCDDMRPCKRCVSTGKTGCKDVEHKPRGRPKIHKK